MSGKVLIVIPTLNRPELCARAVQSVLRQKYKDWGCLVWLNGGPTDELLDSYELALWSAIDSREGWPRKTAIETSARSGLGAALNDALLYGFDERPFDKRPSQVLYWMNLEDDDELDPDYLEVMVAALEESGADVVNCLQRQVPRKIQSDGGPMDAEHLLRRNWINWPMCLWRREVYAKVGPIAEDVGPATDWDYHLRCVAAGIKYHHVEQALVTHHWHDGGGGSPNYCLQVDGKPHIARKRAGGIYG